MAFMKPCSWTYVIGTSFLLPGKQNAGSSFPAATIFRIRLYASNGHNVEPGIDNTGTCSTLAPNWFVLLHLNFTSKPLCLTSTSPHTNCLVLSNATLPVTTSWDFRDKVKNSNNTIAHIVTWNSSDKSKCLSISSIISGVNGDARLGACGFKHASPFTVSFISKLWSGKSLSNNICIVRTPLL